MRAAFLTGRPPPARWGCCQQLSSEQAQSQPRDSPRRCAHLARPTEALLCPREPRAQMPEPGARSRKREPEPGQDGSFICNWDRTHRAHN